MTLRFWPRWLLAAVVLALPAAAGAAQTPQAGDRYALLVGVKEYDKNELRNLPYAEADVEALAQVLRDAGYKRVVVMTIGEGGRKGARFFPTAENIRSELKGLLDDRSPEDSIFVAFSGHGVQFRAGDENFFCPMDTKLSDRKTLVSLTELYGDMAKSKASFKFLLVDACRNDPQSDFSKSRKEVDLETVTRPQLQLPPGGLLAFFSCSAGERSYESPDLKHGVFMHFVLQGLKGQADLDGDGRVSPEELVLFTKKNVPDHVKEEFGAKVRQMPDLKGEARGLVALVSVAKKPKALAKGSGDDAVKPAKDDEGSAVKPKSEGQEKAEKSEEDVQAAFARIAALGPGVHKIKTDSKGRIQSFLVVGQSGINLTLGKAKGEETARTRARLNASAEIVKWLKEQVSVHQRTADETIFFLEGSKENDEGAMREAGKAVEKTTTVVDSVSRGMVRGLQILYAETNAKDKTYTIVLGWSAKGAEAAKQLDAGDGVPAKEAPKKPADKRKASEKVDDKKAISDDAKKFID